MFLLIKRKKYHNSADQSKYFEITFAIPVRRRSVSFRRHPSRLGEASGGAWVGYDGQVGGYDG